MTKKLGNIIAPQQDMRLMDKVDFIHYISEPEQKIENLPTLIIGWRFLKSIYPNAEFSILKQELNNNTWWCFSQFEKRTKYQECIQSFYETIIKNITLQLEYKFLNVFTDFANDFKYIRDIISIIKSKTLVKCYVHYSSFMYIHFNNEVIGINISDLEYVGADKKKILKLFYDNPNNIIFYDYNFIHKDILELLKYNMYLIPYFK